MKYTKKTTIKKDRNIETIFQIDVNSTPRGRLLRFVRESLSNWDKEKSSKSKLFIVTPNPEIVLMAQRDQTLSNILNSADISIPDAVGLVQAVKFLGLKAPKNPLPLRAVICFFQGMLIGLSTLLNKKWLYSVIKPIKGRDFFLDLIKLANKKGWKVFLFGGENGEADLASQKLKMNYKRVKLAALDGPTLDKTGLPTTKADELKEMAAVAKINQFRPHLLFLAFTPPKQEKWYFQNRNKLKIGGAMVVGGTFSYLAGKSSLPPKWMEDLGLEWVWRLLTEPYRLKRIFTAFPVFPLKVYLHKVKNP